MKTLILYLLLVSFWQTHSSPFSSQQKAQDLWETVPDQTKDVQQLPQSSINNDEKVPSREGKSYATSWFQKLKNNWDIAKEKSKSAVNSISNVVSNAYGTVHDGIPTVWNKFKSVLSKFGVFISRGSEYVKDKITRNFDDAKGSALLNKLKQKLRDGNENVSAFFQAVGKKSTDWRDEHGHANVDTGLLHGKVPESQTLHLFKDKEIHDHLHRMVAEGTITQEEMDKLCQDHKHTSQNELVPDRLTLPATDQESKDLALDISIAKGVHADPHHTVKKMLIMPTGSKSEDNSNVLQTIKPKDHPSYSFNTEGSGFHIPEGSGAHITEGSGAYITEGSEGHITGGLGAHVIEGSGSHIPEGSGDYGVESSEPGSGHFGNETFNGRQFNLGFDQQQTEPDLKPNDEINLSGLEPLNGLDNQKPSTLDSLNFGLEKEGQSPDNFGLDQQQVDSGFGLDQQTQQTQDSFQQSQSFDNNFDQTLDNGFDNISAGGIEVVHDSQNQNKYQEIYFPDW